MGRSKNTWKDYVGIYNDVLAKYSISPKLSTKKISDALIDIGDALQGQICSESDSIKYDGLENASAILSHNLRKRDWLDMIQTGVRTTNQKANCTKIEEKLSDNIENNAFINDFNTSLKANVLSGNISSIEVPIQTSYEGNLKTKEIPEFTSLYNDCVETRKHINKVLYKEYDNIAKAFEYLYEGKLNKEDYKLLVDDIHYENGGYPSETTPARTWSKIHKFERLFNAMSVTENLDYFNRYLELFGIKVERINNNVYTKWDNTIPER